MSDSIPTIKEIASRLNVSVSTVSRALNNNTRIGPDTRKKVQDLARELNYEPNTQAINFKKQKSFIIGVIVPHIYEDFFSKAISGIEDTALEEGYTILFGQSHDMIKTERRVVAAMKKQRIDGLIVSLSKETSKYDHFEELKKYNIPVVFFDRVPSIQKVNKVYCNLFNATVEIIDWLFKQGRKRIAFINGPEEIIASRERLSGYIEGISRKKMKIDMQLVEKTDLSEEVTRNAIKKLMNLKRRPNAIISFNDYVHLDAVKWAVENGVKINEEIVFVSYADISLTKHAASPPKVSVDQSPYLQGQLSMQMMIELLNMKEAKKGELPKNYQSKEVSISLSYH